MKKFLIIAMVLLMAVCMVACTNEKGDVQQNVNSDTVNRDVIVDDVADAGAAESDEEFLGGYGGPGEDYVESEQEYEVPEENEEAY